MILMNFTNDNLLILLLIPFPTDFYVSGSCNFYVYSVNVLLQKNPSLYKTDLKIKYENSSF